MKARPQRAVPKIRTRTGMAHEANGPHCNFIKLANLELKRSLYEAVRIAARRRVAEMDEQLAEIGRQEAAILDAVAADGSRALRGPRAAGPARPGECLDEADPPPPARFTLKY